MEQFWRKKSFKQQSDVWEKILKNSGFIDAEVGLKDDRVLKQNAPNSYRQATQLERESREEYFSIIGHFVNNTNILNGEKDLPLFEYACFPNEVEKYVLHRHSEGATIQEIVKEMSINGVSKHRKTVRYIIRRWEMKWGIRFWSLKEMNLKK